MTYIENIDFIILFFLIKIVCFFGNLLILKVFLYLYNILLKTLLESIFYDSHKSFFTKTLQKKTL